MDVKLYDKWWLQFIKGVFFLSAGILILNLGAKILFVFPLYIGIFLMIFGVMDIFTALSSRNLNFAWHWMLAEGLLFLFTGLVLIMKPEINVLTVQLLFGFFAMFTGILSFAGSLNLRSAGIRKWYVSTFSGVVSSAFSVIIIFYSVEEHLQIFNMIVVYIIVSGVLSAVNSLLLERVTID